MFCKIVEQMFYKWRVWATVQIRSIQFTLFLVVDVTNNAQSYQLKAIIYNSEHWANGMISFILRACVVCAVFSEGVI